MGIEQDGIKGAAFNRHIIPIGDELLHFASRFCWCYPTQDTEEKENWIHNAKDCRESRERIGITEEPWDMVLELTTSPAEQVSLSSA